MKAKGAQRVLCLALVLSGWCSNKSAAAIAYPQAPDGGQQVVSNNVAGLARGHPATLHGLEMEEVTIAEPFRVYYGALTNLAQGRFLSMAEPRSWQYLLLHATNAVGAATLGEKDGKLEFLALYETNFSAETLEALRRAKQLPQARKQDYEFRRLDVAPLHFVAVWLHRDADDILMPLPPTFGRWNAYQAYSEREMLKLLRPEAQQRLKEPRLIY